VLDFEMPTLTEREVDACLDVMLERLDADLDDDAVADTDLTDGTGRFGGGAGFLPVSFFACEGPMKLGVRVPLAVAFELLACCFVG
jgi:hypothetical protein